MIYLKIKNRKYFRFFCIAIAYSIHRAVVLFVQRGFVRFECQKIELFKYFIVISFCISTLKLLFNPCMTYLFAIIIKLIFYFT